MTLYSQEGNPQSGEERFGHILGLLKNTSVNHHTAKASCPAHKDNQPSLEVKLQSDDKISLKCFRGCDYRDILSSINLQPAFLYPPPRQRRSKKHTSSAKSQKRIVKIYQYRKLNGHPAYQAVRFEPKDFRMRQDESDWSMKNASMVPYNLPEVATAIRKKQTILFVEGEKDADNGMKLGFTTTTVAGGNGKWRDEYAEYFQEADLVFLPDNDEAGITGALKIATKLHGIAERIRLLTLPVGLKGDLSDWIEAGGDKKKLSELIFLQGAFLDESILVNFLNKKHAIVMVQGTLAVMNEQFNPTFNRNEITLSTTPHFQERYGNKKHIRTIWKKDTKEENMKKQAAGKTHSDVSYSEKKDIQPQGKIWLQSPQRRQYDGFFFDPDAPLEVNKQYNLWRDFGVKAKKGDCSLYKHHIWEVIANGNAEIYEYILNWMADAVQNITKRPGVTMVLRGGQGTGKGTMINMFGKLYGQHFLQVSDAKHIVGSFNAHLRDCLLLFADEAFYAGDKKHASILKNIITEPTRPIEYKGKDIFPVKNHTRLMMASNQSWVAPIEKDDRRFFVVDVSESKKKDRKYFQELYDQMENKGGYEALLYELRERDISNVDVRSYPQTKAILENKLESLDSIGQWVYEGLVTGEIIRMTIEHNISEMYERYKESCGKVWPANRHAWAREMKKFFPHMERPQKFGQGKRYYEFESLEKCREEFAARLDAEIDWEEEE